MADFMSLFLPPFLSPSTPALAPSPLTSSQFLHPHNQALSSKASALGSDLARAGRKHDQRKCRGGPRCHPLAPTMLSVLPSSGRGALPQLVWLALLWVTMPYPTPVPKQVRVSRTGAEQESIHSWRFRSGYGYHHAHSASIMSDCLELLAPVPPAEVKT